MSAATSPIFGFPDHAFTASGGDWLENYPVTALGNDRRDLPGRSASLETPATQFRIDLGAIRRTRLAHLYDHNLTAAALIRVTFYNVAPNLTGLNLPIWSSGFVSWLGLTFDSLEDLEFEDPAFFTGTVSEAALAGEILSANIIADRAYLTRTIEVEIVDPLNPDGFVQIGFAKAADVFQPSRAFEFGAEFGFRGRTVSDEGDDGAQNARRRGKPRTAKLDFPFLTLAERRVWAEMQRIMDTDAGLVVIPFPATPEEWQLNLPYYLKSLKPWRRQRAQWDTASVELEQVR